MVNIPQRGDIIWIDFDPRAGREQSGVRPALVLSRDSYNRFGLCIVCPITSQIKGYPFEVIIEKESPILGAILTSHVTSIDWRVRAVRGPHTYTVQETTMQTVTGFVSGLVSGK